MIDGFGIGGEHTPPKLQQLIDSGELAYSNIRKKKPDPKTGEIILVEYKKIEDAQFGITIKVYPSGRYKINGSFHKCKNKGKHNYDLFYFMEFINVLSKLSDKYGIDFSKVEIGSIEFGVNIRVSFDPWIFINAIVLWCGKGEGKIQKTELGLVIIFSQFEIKIYSKTEQSKFRKMDEYIPKDIYILRIEVKIKKTIKLKGVVDIQYVNQLTEPCVWEALSQYLITEVYDKLLIIDEGKIKSSDLSEKEKELLYKACRKEYWEQYSRYTTTGAEDLKREKNAKRQAKKRERKDIVELSDRISTMRIDIRSRMEIALSEMRQVKELIETPTNSHITAEQNLLSSNSLKNEMSQNYHLSEIRHVQNLFLFEDIEINKHCQHLFRKSHSSHSAKRVLCDIDWNGRLCSATKLPLDNLGSPQGARLNSSGVRFYYENYPELFIERLFPLLSKRWYSYDVKIWLKEIAHIIRCRKYNPENNPINNKRRRDKRRNNPGQLSLDFDS